MIEQDKIKQVLFKFEDAGLVSKNIEQVIECISTQLIGIGIGEQGFVTSKEDVRKIYEAGLKEQNSSNHSLEYNRIEILIHGDAFAVVCAEITVLSQSIHAPDAITKSKLQQSLSMVKELEEWKICALHASTPIVTEESLEAYPLKFAEKTLQSLREKIGEAAYLAEEQYRQAILADTVAFYIIDFTLDVFEKCQLNCDWCAYTAPGTPYEDFIINKVHEYLLEEDESIFIQCFCKETIMEAFSNAQKELSCQYRMKLHDGSNLWVVSILRLITDIATGHQKGIMYVKNIDHSKREELVILNRATYDEMTGVYNKGMMKHYVSEQLSKNHGIFIMLDIDNFKIINDTYGHPVGDLVLIMLAKVITNSFLNTSLIGRMGGDEFAIFIPGENITEQTNNKLHELLIRINQIQLSEYTSILITCSIGVAYGEKSARFDEIYRKADDALYLSKKSGKNRISYL